MVIQIIQIISAVFLIILILIQNRGAGLGSAFGGESTVYRTKRGAEKGIFIATIIIAIVFLGTSLASVIF